MIMGMGNWALGIGHWALLNHGMKKITLKSKSFVDTGFYDGPTERFIP